MAANTDIAGSFKVGSWLIGVDTLNREQLIKSCQGWESGHTDLLILELDALLSGDSILDLSLVKTDAKKLLYASVVLNKYRHVPCNALAVGLTLIG